MGALLASLGKKTWSEQAVQDVMRKLDDSPQWRGERYEGSGRPRETTKAQDNVIYQEVPRPPALVARDSARFRVPSSSSMTPRFCSRVPRPLALVARDSARFRVASSSSMTARFCSRVPRPLALVARDSAHFRVAPECMKEKIENTHLALHRGRMAEALCPKSFCLQPSAC